MKFFFPDSSDLVDPSFDFVSETRSPTRVRQRDDLYAHELFDAPPFDGLLVSKAIVDGTSGGAGRYTAAQRQRLLREGIREFMRLDLRPATRHLVTMGDCGAFSYVREETPPFSVSDVLDFYEQCGFDYGLSVDHVILDYNDRLDAGLPGVNAPPKEWTSRRELTLELAGEFLREHRSGGLAFVPIGVAQGWSPASYANSVASLQAMGYDNLALGGVVPLKSSQVLKVLAAVSEVLSPETRLHLLGITRCEHLTKFASFGVTSFDSTSPLRQAFKDETDNYYTETKKYSAIRVPQSDANPKIKKRISSGAVSQDEALHLERECLDSLAAFDRGECDLTVPLAVLEKYETLCFGRFDRSQLYAEALEAAPWRECDCNICRELGINVILFRGAERNRRRGFHNLHVFNRQVRNLIPSS